MSSGGSFVAILLSIPLTAVALVGVIGVPKLQELISSASPKADDDFDHEGFSSRSKSKRGSKSSRDSLDDADPWGNEAEGSESLFDDLDEKPKTSKPKVALNRSKSRGGEDEAAAELDAPADDPFGRPGRGRFGTNPREPEEVEMVSTDPFRNRSSVTTADFNSPSRTQPPARTDGFAESINRLRTLGVSRFHLEPGLSAGQFLFVCQLDGESATIHRFEAEATDPAAAVNDVYQQVTAWQAEQTVSKTAGISGRPSR
jgi:hypothetical protein